MQRQNKDAVLSTELKCQHFAFLTSQDFTSSPSWPCAHNHLPASASGVAGTADMGLVNYILQGERRLESEHLLLLQGAWVQQGSSQLQFQGT